MPVTPGSGFLLCCVLYVLVVVATQTTDPVFERCVRIFWASVMPLWAFAGYVAWALTGYVVWATTA